MVGIHHDPTSTIFPGPRIRPGLSPIIVLIAVAAFSMSLHAEPVAQACHVALTAMLLAVGLRKSIAEKEKCPDRERSGLVKDLLVLLLVGVSSGLIVAVTHSSTFGLALSVASSAMVLTLHTIDTIREAARESAL